MHLVRLLKRTSQGIGVVCLFGTGLVAWDISRKRRSEGQTFPEALRQYFLVAGLRQFGKSVWSKIDADTKNIRQAQEETLLQRIQETAATQYGKDFHFSDIKSRDDFIRYHPLTRYDHYRDYVARVAAGEKLILTAEDPQILALTSGTSGTSSMMPMLANQTKVFFKYGIAPCFHFMTQSFPETYNLQKELKLFYSPKPRDTLAGIPVGPNSSNPQNSQRVWLMYSTPPAAYDVCSEPEATYLYLLFALKDRNLGMLEANFVSLIYAAMLNLEKNWRRLVDDIEAGELSKDLDISDDVRSRINALLKPDPRRSDELRAEFSKGFQGIAKRIWPHCNLLLTVDSGSFELYGRQLRESFTKGIPVYSPLYGATEGLVGLNIAPLSGAREYLLLPRAMFFEFIPVAQCDEVQPKTLFMDQLEVGETYELVITNMSCFFRYRFGDVVQVTSMHNQCPQVEFLYRQGQFLNIRGEKTSERCFYEALKAASAEWSEAKLRDYCCTPSVLLQQAGAPKDNSITHYVLFVELEGHDTLSKKDIEKIDEKLCEKSFAYGSLRQKNSLGPVEVCVVRPGTFQDLKNYHVKQGNAGANQYKVPRVVNKPETLVYLLSRLSY